jgi:hypothetical protein
MVRGRWWVSIPLAVAVLSVACGDGGFSNPDRSRLKGTASCEFAPPPPADSESGPVLAPRTATLHAGRGSLTATIAVENLPRHLRSLERSEGISFEWRIWIFERRSFDLVGVLLWDGLSARPTANELGADLSEPVDGASAGAKADLVTLKFPLRNPPVPLPSSFLWTAVMTGNNNRTGAGAAAPCPFGGPAAPRIGVPGAGVSQFP